ncbi:hypothetical protein A1Q1_01543 [Trichosporon asahii var. asahii CBS 2479]|uniref:Uncharacterized protein n=1 Tax=Trichosporon asahii var. asahii (strain ATCC 90039 / CBS 2479 / JCM 2466 / KCTC 7840 / NBRC 103889/ NCYC 2677 / UAMH 7654) TaxID=1186058 RepID=J5T5W2_TRIAS|nr:hypothetical protein A1Q1_01543 [Trichosporon asahii var. asahii CBS 2479]EJT49341.1 hypothetical protein A1Q1_01543 [Trichosporon asahii var. asahii CBS 2479]
MTRATYRELFPDDEEDSASGDDRHQIAFPWSRNNYEQNRLTSAAHTEEPPPDIPSGPGLRMHSPASASRAVTPFRRSATRPPSPTNSKHEGNVPTPPPNRSASIRAASPFLAAEGPRGLSTHNHLRDSAPDPESARSQRGACLEDQGRTAAVPHTVDGFVEDQQENVIQGGDPQLPLSERDLDDILKVLSSGGPPQQSGSERHTNVHLPSVQPSFQRRAASGRLLHQRLAQGGMDPPQSAQQTFPAESPGDPLGILIQLTHNMQYMSNQVNMLNAKLHMDVDSLETDLAAANESAENAKQAKADSIDNAKRCLQSIKQQYQGLAASLASQKSISEGSRAKNLALISQLHGSREDLKKQVAECKTVSETKTSAARQALEALKDCQAWPRGRAQRRSSAIVSVLANSPDLSQQLESAQLALQSTFGDTSQKLIACVESYVSPSVQADGRLSQTKLMFRLRSMIKKMEERDSLVTTLRGELQEARSSMLAEAQTHHALAASRDQMKLKMEQQEQSSSRLIKLERTKVELRESHLKEMKHNEGVTVASMELLTLKRGLEAKSKEIEALTARLKESEVSHNKEVEVDEAVQRERVAIALAQERKVNVTGRRLFLTAQALFDKMSGSTPTERTSNSSRVRRLLPYQRPPTPPHPRNEHASTADQAATDKASNRSV